MRLSNSVVAPLCGEQVSQTQQRPVVHWSVDDDMPSARRLCKIAQRPGVRVRRCRCCAVFSHKSAMSRRMRASGPSSLLEVPA